MVNGEFVPAPNTKEFLYNDMGISEDNPLNDITLYGIICPTTALCEGRYISFEYASSSPETNSNDVIINDSYYFIKFPDNNVDTLKIHTEQYYDHFEFRASYFINGEQQTTINADGEDVLVSNSGTQYLTFQE